MCKYSFDETQKKSNLQLIYSHSQGLLSSLFDPPQQIFVKPPEKFGSHPFSSYNFWKICGLSEFQQKLLNA